MDARNSYYFFSSAQCAFPDDSMGNPWTLDAVLPIAALRWRFSDGSQHLDCSITLIVEPNMRTLLIEPPSPITSIPSMSRRGNCYEIAVGESFWSTLKNELIYRRKFTTRAEARIAIFDYIETFFNHSRRHSALGDKSPLAHGSSLNVYPIDQGEPKVITLLAALRSTPRKRSAPAFE